MNNPTKKGAVNMNLNEKGQKQFCELYQNFKECAANANGDSFVMFLRFCAERLKKGDSVQVIWRDYLKSVQ